MQTTEPSDNLDFPRAARGGTDAYAVLRNRDVLLYLSGRLVASFGQQMFVMALGWELYERTRSGFALGLVGLTQVVPMALFTLPAGHLADNHDRKRIIVLTTILLGAANAGMTMISAAQAAIPFIYLCLFITGSARTFLWAATASFLPMLVDRKDFSRAVTWNVAMFQFSSIAGPATAGALIHVTHKAAIVYALNAFAATLF